MTNIFQKYKITLVKGLRMMGSGKANSDPEYARKLLRGESTKLPDDWMVIWEPTRYSATGPIIGIAPKYFLKGSDAPRGENERPH